MTPSDTSISAELARLGEAIELLDRLRELFNEMEDGGEQERAWDYLRARFAEFEQAEMPHFEELSMASDEEYDESDGHA